MFRWPSEILALRQKGTLRSDVVTWCCRVLGPILPHQFCGLLISLCNRTEWSPWTNSWVRRHFFSPGDEEELLGGFNPIEKYYSSQNGPFPQIGVKILKLKPRPSSAGDQEWRCYTEYWGDDELPTKTMHYSTHLDANVLVIFMDFHFVVSVVRKQPSEKNRLRVRQDGLTKTSRFGSRKFTTTYRYRCTRGHDELPTQNNALVLSGKSLKDFPMHLLALSLQGVLFPS